MALIPTDEYIDYYDEWDMWNEWDDHDDGNNLNNSNEWNDSKESWDDYYEMDYRNSDWTNGACDEVIDYNRGALKESLVVMTPKMDDESISKVLDSHREVQNTREEIDEIFASLATLQEIHDSDTYCRNTVDHADAVHKPDAVRTSKISNFIPI